MKFSENLAKKITLGASLLFCMLIVCILSGCHYINQKAGLEDDNIVEEVVEYIIDEKIGIDVDLTPDSPEK